MCRPRVRPSTTTRDAARARRRSPLRRRFPEMSCHELDVRLTHAVDLTHCSSLGGVSPREAVSRDQSPRACMPGLARLQSGRPSTHDARREACPLRRFVWSSLSRPAARSRRRLPAAPSRHETMRLRMARAEAPAGAPLLLRRPTLRQPAAPVHRPLHRVPADRLRFSSSDASTPPTPRAPRHRGRARAS